MIRFVLLIYLGIAAFSLCSCAPHSFKANYVIPPASVSKITLLRCDPQSKPLHCEKIVVSYRDGSEQLQAH